MADVLKITVNTSEVQAAMRRAGDTSSLRQPMMKIIGEHMRASVMKTFRGQGSPPNSWTPLAAWTVTGARNRIGFRKGILTGRKGGKGQLRAGKQILIESGRLRNSVSYETQQSSGTVRIGSNLVYAAIHQLGGFAGRRSPSRGAGRTKQGPLKPGQFFIGGAQRHREGPFRRPYIPARPYLVFRPEDPAEMEAELDVFVAERYRKAGFETFDGRGIS